ncbi:metal ABC transporter substrate-binding protein, partial [Phytoactinopolyspora endophytica]|uniref:metal ABC transporter substrate-binding protein n=1 Tax=Phytoactinopolyspora endophytica TaxID=1642495 RepID=UPI0013EB007B
MKSCFFTRGLTALAVSGLVLAGCGSDDESTDDGASTGDGPSVTAAFYPMAFIAERVAGEHATVENLTQPGVESHDMELTAQQVGSLSDAELVLYLRDFQPAVDEAIDQNSSGVTVDAAEVVELRPDEHDHDHDDEDDHGDDAADDHTDDEGHDEDNGHDHDEEEADDHDDTEDEADEHEDHADDHGSDDADHDEDEHDEAADDEHDEGEHEDEHDEATDDGHDHGDLDGDPHLWLDPTNMATLAHAIADELAELDPDNADSYDANAHEVMDELDELDEEFEAGLAQCERSLIVVSHEAFGYLADRYALEQLGVAGLDPDSEPSPARVAEVHDTIEDEGVTTVFYERLSSPDVV